MQKSDLTQSETINFAKHPELVSSFKTILGEIETVIDVLQREDLDFELLVKTNQGLLQDLRLAINKYPEVEEYYQQHLEELGELNSLEGFFKNPEYVLENRRNFIDHFKVIHQCIEKPLNDTNRIEEKQINYRIFKVLYGHKSGVSSVDFSPDSQLLVSGSFDSTVKIWNLKGENLQTFTGHQSGILDVAFSPDGKIIASASKDQTVKLWTLQGEELLTLRGHSEWVWGIDFHRNGKQLVSVSADKTARIWDISGLNNFNHDPIIIRGHSDRIHDVTYSINGNGDTFITASDDGTVRFWNQEKAILKPFSHSDRVRSVCSSYHGVEIYTGCSDRKLRSWTLNGELLFESSGHRLGVDSVTSHPKGFFIATGSADKTIRFWSTQGKALKTIQGHEDRIWDICFSPDGNLLASASDDRTIRIWQHNDSLETINLVPQGISNDLAQGDDQLSIEDELQAIADVLLLRQLEPPIAVGILGTWGSGKSFGMHLIQQRVNEIRCSNRQLVEAWGEGLEEDDPDREKKLSPYVGHIYQIKFNAWSYAKQNLWASLMQEIFSELNQQITFERQLQQAGVDLLSGGQLWEVLENLNTGDHQYFLEQNLDPETFERLRNIELKSELKNELLETLRRSQNQVQQDIKEQETLLQETKQALKKRQCEIAEGMDNNLNLALASSPDLIKQVHKHFGKNVELKITESIRAKDPDFDPQNVKDLINVFGESANLFLGDRKPEVFSFPSLRRWLPRVWRPLLIFLLLVFICILIPWKFYPWLNQLLAAKSDSTTWSFITSAFGMLGFGTPASFKARDLLTNFNKWSKDANLTIQETQKKLQQEMRAAVEQDEQAQKLNTQLTTLKKDIESKKQKLPELQYDSLAEFLGDRLKPENYTDMLGMINQVQQDLQDLSDKLLPPKEKRDEKIKDLFPRGEPRVILYIDDLDRCPPDRVVEVLETVQLLLKTQLFVVVLAVDDRYIARALEEVYSGVLKRRGKPSGIDYLEKIIQIPYRMRPISSDTIEQYLGSQINVLENIPTEIPTTEQKSLPPALEQEPIQTTATQKPITSSQQTNDAAIAQQDFSQAQTIELPPIELEPEVDSVTSELGSNINEINTIEQAELDLIVKCCQYVDITPRTGKRLINIYKILKIIWQKRQEPTPETKQVLFSFLALSGRYPDFMRNLFEEIDTELQEKLDETDNQLDYKDLLNSIYPQVPERDYHAQREWRKFKTDISQMIPTNPFILNKDDFELALSFCFVGDIGYDPDDFSRDPIMPTQQ
ncbi:KAP P-loop domain protein [[Leptolyngbya] sp. PCC 7376]|uniref:P-loop NTPase fold protein n=1 Tax=[Leptolyngbya] sp. PCC 7376 TaxID=111781 RepID=UPI00029EE5A6|nr:P-loop NTPase fold protein [[Leptolyngbya] sp. PCC 7376]AFY38870.1 KAP P-loop domain protein [[Leptolyngbya] sp. PCC 7376]